MTAVKTAQQIHGPPGGFVDRGEVRLGSTVLSFLSVRAPALSSVARGHDERLRRELEVDTEGQRQRRGGGGCPQIGLGGW